jgi:hypothetical protein
MEFSDFSGELHCRQLLTQTAFPKCSKHQGNAENTKQRKKKQ